MSRAFDAIVLGATGYTGTLVLEYLNTAASAKGIRWAAAGRNEAKVKAALESVKVSGIDVVVADTSNKDSIEALAKQCTVVIDCAGPFDIHGPPVLEACLKHKTHYVDITGEFTYVRRAIKEYHDEAAKAGLFFIPTCGFDSVPSDIGNFLIHTEAAKRGTKAVDVRSYFSLKGGGLSGGTAHTICTIMDYLRKEDLKLTSLNPSDGPRPVALPIKKGFWFDPWVGKWTCPFMMAGINERVARRSNALYGHTGAYHEAMAMPMIPAMIATVVFYTMMISFSIPFVRNLMKKYVLPAQGTGPNEAARNKSKFLTQYRGKTESGDLLSASLKYNGDAYVFTAVSVVESALCIIDLEKKGAAKRAASGHTGGVLTPATAFGQSLVDRLVAAGVEISVSAKKEQ